MKLPYLSNGDGAWYPKDGACPVCNTMLEDLDRVAVVDGGALLFDKSGNETRDPKRLKAYLRVGIRGQGLGASATAEIVRDLERGQFELLFCSPGCLRSWINQMLDELEAKIDASPSVP